MEDRKGTISVDESQGSQETPNEQGEETSSQRTNEDSESDLPEKFRGKSKVDIAKAYADAERGLHEGNQERSFLKRQNQEAMQRLAILEASLANSQRQQSDPLDITDEEFETNPLGSLKKLRDNFKRGLQQVRQEVSAETRGNQANDVYERRKKENPDFVDRESDMAQLANRFRNLIKPEMMNSPDTIDALDLMSRGQRLPEYIKKAEEKVRKERDTIKEEKRKAFSESSNTQGDNGSKFATDDEFSKMSREDQLKELAKIEKTLTKV